MHTTEKLGPIGLIGLGNIGGGMCRRLLDREYAVVGFDVSTDARAMAENAGASVVSSAREVAETTSVTISSLPNSTIVLNACAGPEGWLEGASQESTLIETSTIEPAAIRDLAALAHARGKHVLDVALSGEPPQAAAGELVFQVGGDEKLFQQHKALLEAMSRKINRTGDIGTAKTVKLVNNLMSIGNIAVASEAFVLGVKCGMDPTRLFEILSVSGGRSAHFNHDFPQVLTGDYTPGFRTGLALKDIRLVMDLASSMGYSTRLAPVVEALYAEACERESADEHFTSVVKIYEDGAGKRVSPRE
ncbi:NAD(P)-dependent oxidoreductase [Pseudonocardia sulfidoxydans]|uniref:NAD(P)-dependent oxidoreductase n=1 Tax=Pseudonocardia sulfidoxydans TaxID=54011 RepID=UPI0011BE6661|nr:NAD(P)-dependent oxidoreductase [Pseudonocardia sulfidoxydans]